MSWGTSYKFEGYLSRIGKNELREKLKEYNEINTMLWERIMILCGMGPHVEKDCEGNEYEYSDYIQSTISKYRDTIEENLMTIARIHDCIDAMEENPENVTEG